LSTSDGIDVIFQTTRILYLSNNSSRRLARGYWRRSVRLHHFFFKAGDHCFSHYAEPMNANSVALDYFFYDVGNMNVVCHIGLKIKSTPGSAIAAVFTSDHAPLCLYGD